MENRKIRNTAAVLDKIAGVCAGILCAAGIACAVFAVLLLILGEKIVGSVTLELDFIKFYLSENFQTITLPVKMFGFTGLLSAGILCFIAFRICAVIRRILVPMKEGRPFESGVSADLKKIAQILFIGGAAAELTGIAGRMLLIRAYPLQEIFSSAAITKMDFVFNMDLGFAAAACIFLFLSYIFAYGQSLQQESDETL